MCSLPQGSLRPPWLLLTAAHQEKGEVRGEVERAVGSWPGPAWRLASIDPTYSSIRGALTALLGKALW